ncbi:MAG TPA: bifunctional 5,10-methylenetetrahydrofolate dehydrogenase/5,10-methenyltetrahydrofolate cyclohydrolase [Saprospiraceae bacterium]|nr:bifunctional 5,10-methylenetetrahydrofolate dehydrogenase/5,10-methenyltetrahydrofolate cyclohydrolase [Saprospiraceae bacterium]
MKLIDGKELANQLKEGLRQKTDKLAAEGKRRPHLAAILVGNNPASESYVRNKVRSCEQAGFESTLIRRPADVSESELLAIIDELNNNPAIDGYIVQLPLPDHIHEQKLLLAIHPDKDVDGFHPMNFGKMAQGMDAFLPATPYGILLMLEHYGIETSGKEVVVIGRSNIVGTPMSILLSRKSNPGNATVTLVHSRTKNLKAHTLNADIIIAAIGIPYFLKADMVKDGAVIIDVGINRVEDATRKRGYRLVGDVDFEGLARKVSFMTPVPGGVGPMTVLGLLMNTMKAYLGR